jgi:hypothetical protein
MIFQILEKTVERLREELKREKEDLRTEKSKRQVTEKAVLDSYKNVEQVICGFIFQQPFSYSANKLFQDMIV